MHSYANATQNTKTFDKFAYYVEDCSCKLCMYYQKQLDENGKEGKKVCILEECCCKAERTEAARNGRIKRKAGWNRGWDAV